VSAWAFGLALAIGWLVGLPGWSGDVAAAGAANVAATRAGHGRVRGGFVGDLSWWRFADQTT
jgi:hypothetical protein